MLGVLSPERIEAAARSAGALICWCEEKTGLFSARA